MTQKVKSVRIGLRNISTMIFVETNFLQLATIAIRQHRAATTRVSIRKLHTHLHHILNTPNFVSGTGALSAAE